MCHKTHITHSSELALYEEPVLGFKDRHLLVSALREANNVLLRCQPCENDSQIIQPYKFTYSDFLQVAKNAC